MDSFLSNPKMKAHCEAVWNKFNILTNDKLQIWPCLQLYAGCALWHPLQQRISERVIALVRPIYLICCTTLSARSSLSLNAPIYWSGKGALIIPFSIRATKQNHVFLEVVPKRHPQKVPVFLPPLSCPCVAYPLPLWSSSSSIRHYSTVLQCKVGAP